MDDLDIQLEKAETQASAKVLHGGTASNTSSNSSSSSHDLEQGHQQHHPRPQPTTTTTGLSAATTVSRHKTQTEEDHDHHSTHLHALTHTHTVGASPTSRSALLASFQPLPAFGGNKPYPPEIPAERQDYVVDFDGPGDPLHPLNWPLRTKLIYAAIGALASFCSTFASSVLSAATEEIGRHFHIGREVATLASTLYLCGYGVGPAIWGPLSELRGRKLPLLLGNFGFSVFAAGTAVAKDVQTLMICRFFMGVFGSCPLVVVAAVYADMFRAEVRSIALVCFASSIFVGPMIGPVVGSFTAVSYLGWRWDAYWSVIMGSAVFILLAFVFKETFPPIVLVGKAEYLRRRTKNWAIHAKQEEIEIDLREIVEKNLSRPLRMITTEPILIAVGFYQSFVYGLIYIVLSAYPLVFVGVHHWRPGVGSLPFLGMMLGMLTAGVVAVILNKQWVRKYHAAGNRFQAEWRMPLCFVGGIAFTIGLFWFGWTGAFRSVHWIVPTIAGYVLGFGILSIFMMLILYIVDAYLMFAASALAGVTITRSLFAAGCTLFDRQMFVDLKIQYAGTLLGCVAAALIPVPLLLIKYGPKLREKSKWAPKLPPIPPKV